MISLNDEIMDAHGTDRLLSPALGWQRYLRYLTDMEKAVDQGGDAGLADPIL